MNAIENLELWNEPSDEDLILGEMETLRSRAYELQNQIEQIDNLRAELKKIIGDSDVQ